MALLVYFNHTERLNMSTNLRKVVITGSTGTIGIALTNYLTSRGVVCVLINRRRLPESTYTNLDRIVFLDGALNSYRELMESPDLPKDCDAFLHLAWAGTFGPTRDDVAMQIDDIRYTMDAIELAKAMGCKCFVGAGSQAEYGKGVELDERPLTPVSGYGMAKLCAGQLGRLKASQLGLRFNWVRIFSVIGPNMGEGTITEYVVSTLLKGESPKMTPCEQIWDFLYTEDASAAFAAVLEKGVDGATYELGSGQHDSLANFVRRIPGILNVDIPVSVGAIPYPPNQIMKLCANIESLKRDTGWAPIHTYEEAVMAIAEAHGWKR